MRYEASPGQYETVHVLDRAGTAVALREKGIDVDFEDWDGLTDESVLETLMHLLHGSGIDMQDVVKEIR